MFYRDLTTMLNLFSLVLFGTFLRRKVRFLKVSVRTVMVCISRGIEYTIYGAWRGWYMRYLEVGIWEARRISHISDMGSI